MSDIAVLNGMKNASLPLECDNNNDWYESDLHLAAELGKTLLERNKELEESLHEHQMVIEDQTLEIEYLSKQTVALREVNESRLKIYEQLELSIQDLEAKNQRLEIESVSDKKRIACLSESLDSLELRCEELQILVDELKTQPPPAAPNGQRISAKCARRRTLDPEEFQEAQIRRINGSQDVDGDENNWMRFEDYSPPSIELVEEVLQLRETVRDLRAQNMKQQRHKEDLEIEMSFLMQEMEVLQKQVTTFKEKAMSAKILEIDLHAFEEFNRSSRSYSSPVVQAMNMGLPLIEVEEDLPQIRTGTLMRLSNGAQAYGSQESLVSSGAHLLSTNGNETPECPSLLNELDTEYRMLIEKYEALLNSHHQKVVKEQEAGVDAGIQVEENFEKKLASPKDHWEIVTVNDLDLIEKGNDNVNVVHDQGKEHIEMSVFKFGESVFNNSACDYPSKTESFGEFSSRAAQTELRMNDPSLNRRHIDLASDVSPVDSRFNNTPAYKKLFQEIFSVLKGGTSSSKQFSNSRSSTPARLPNPNHFHVRIDLESVATSTPKERNATENAKNVLTSYTVVGPSNLIMPGRINSCTGNVRAIADNWESRSIARDHSDRFGKTYAEAVTSGRLLARIV